MIKFKRISTKYIKIIPPDAFLARTDMQPCPSAFLFDINVNMVYNYVEQVKYI